MSRFPKRTPEASEGPKGLINTRAMDITPNKACAIIFPNQLLSSLNFCGFIFFAKYFSINEIAKKENQTKAK